jgi:RimJ/RimL family protein N-acetyltransferase
VEHFRTQGQAGIGCWRDDHLNDLLPPDPDYDGATLMFTDRAPDAAPAPPLPTGYTLVERDADLLRQSVDYEATLQSFGSVEAAMRLTLGVMVLHDSAVVCEAGTGAPTHGMIEVGVTTAPEHRQRGLARAACAALIARCEQRGYATWWDCAAQNTASARLARWLGYRRERPYRYVSYAQPVIGNRSHI